MSFIIITINPDILAIVYLWLLLLLRILLELLLVYMSRLYFIFYVQIILFYTFLFLYCVLCELFFCTSNFIC